MKAIPALAIVLSFILLASGINSSFGSYSHPYISQWGEYGLIKSGFFLYPQNIAIDADGNVYVTDLGNDRVQKFDNNGNFIQSWGSSGSGAGQFNSIAGIAIYENNVFVVDNQLNRIQKFDTSGNFITLWGGNGNDPGKFLSPNGIAIREDGLIYVVDTGNQRIQKFTSEGDYLSEFGQSGTADDQFVSPMGITLDNNGQIFVSDPGSHKIIKFDSDGNFLQSFSGSVAGLKISPHGLDTDPDGHLYVADIANNRIVLLDIEGIALTTFGTMGSGNGQFKMPKDLALDYKGDLFIVDSNNHRIQKFNTPIIVEESDNESDSTLEQTTEVQTTSNVNPIPGDLTKPMIIAPNDMTVEGIGNLTPISIGQATASDASGIQSLTSNAPDAFPLGITTVIWTAIDGSGNMAIATQTITVQDTIPPTISPLSDIVTEAASPTQNTVELTPPTFSDNIGILSITNDAPDVFPLGETLVTWTVSDLMGNTATVSQNVVVTDSTIPTLHVPENITAEATSLNKNQIYIGESSVIDNGEILSITNDAPELFLLGNTTVTWIAADSYGNTASKQQLVSIIDTTPPSITSPENMTVEATSIDANIIEIGSPIVEDIQQVVVTNDAPDSFPLGETIVTWTATDASGNTSNSTQVISVVDTTAPTITIPYDIVSEATGLENNIVDLGEITIEDVAGISSISNNAPETFPFGTTIVTWNVTDEYGNAASVDQTVSVIDTTLPNILPPSDVVFEAIDPLTNYIELGTPLVEDLVDISGITNDAPESFPVGLTTVTWTATDTSGNSASASQLINVVDTTAPIISVPENVVTEATGSEGALVDIGIATSSDILGIDSIVNDAPEIFPIGTTTVNWNAIDTHGNSVIASQNVTVVDSTPPSIAAPLDIVFEATSLNDNSIDIGIADAADLVGISSITNDAPITFSIGETIVTWTATDSSGNSAQATQTISVVDTTSPTIISPEAITIEATSLDQTNVELPEIIAHDTIGVVSITNDAPENYSIGDTIVTWTATDAAGNSETTTQLITVVDTTTPTLFIPKTATVEATSQSGNIVEFGTASADDAVGVTSLTNDAPATFPLGMTSITWTASDAAGNTATGIQQVIVVDTTAPSIISPQNIISEAQSATENTIDIGLAEATDAVGVVSITNDSPAVFPLGETIVTWTATDGSGNSANTAQIIRVLDTTAPEILAPEDIVVEATSLENIITLSQPTTSDTVSDVDISNDAPTIFPLGETIVTWTATDVAGNSATASQLVTMIDTTSPTIIVPDDIVIEATSSLHNLVEIGNATASDIVGILEITNDAPEEFPYGQTIIAWTATDTSGNSITDSQTVTVVDTTSPTIVAPKNLTVEATSIAGNIVDIGAADAFDVIGVASLINDAPESFSLGENYVTWTATDQDGNSASVSQKITIVDTTPPELTIPENIIIDATSLENIVSIGTASSTDFVDTSPIISNDAPDVFQLGETIVTWTAIDTFGNAANATQIIEVQACGKPQSYYNHIIGNLGDDLLVGTSTPDLIFGLGGDDTIIGDKGNDCIFGGEGEDILFGNEGNDSLNGGEGNDIIKGQSGDDYIVDGTGSDMIDAGDDIDSCIIENSENDLTLKCEKFP